jgi:hypothetical protein
MSARKRKLSDDEIEAEVLADLADSSAWGEPLYVAPLTAPRPAWVIRGRHLELSARFHVLSVLHRLGGEASLTNAHPGSVDITVLQSPGRALTLDVQTLVGTTKWLLQPFSARKHHYLVFVLFTTDAAANPTLVPDVIVVPSLRLKEFLGRDRPASIDIPSLARDLGISDPWQQLLTQAA